MEDAVQHGGDWAAYDARYGAPPRFDFSANVNPFGASDAVLDAAREAVGETARYPDPYCRALCRAVAAAEGVPPSWCLCANGASDLIYRLAAAVRPRRALITAPTFAEYEAALSLNGCRVDVCTLSERDDFTVGASMPDGITPWTELVFLCNPNNPTGRTVDDTLLHALLRRCQSVGALLVIDECFGDFLDVEQSMKGALAESPNLLILKAFTKLHALAGLRLGYCLCADEALLRRMRCAGAPWSVSCVAQAAGLAAVREGDAARRRVRALLKQERPYVTDALRALGFRVVAGEANYLLFFSRVPLCDALEERGILLRDCANYRGLGDGWYRTAVRTREENDVLLRALSDIVGKERTGWQKTL